MSSPRECVDCHARSFALHDNGQCRACRLTDERDEARRQGASDLQLAREIHQARDEIARQRDEALALLAYTRGERDRWYARRQEALAALRQLVALKDDKDAHGRTPEYEQLQPIAWQAARAVLAKAEPQEEPTHG